MTKETAIKSGQPGAIYVATKKDAELAVWKWAEAHAHVEVTTSKSYLVIVSTVWLKVC